MLGFFWVFLLRRPPDTSQEAVSMAVIRLFNGLREDAVDGEGHRGEAMLNECLGQETS